MDDSINGFLPGSRASLMLDVVFVAMFLVLPVMAWSIAAVRRGRYALHKRTQLVLAGVMLVAVTVFEIDIRLFTNWRARAEASPFYPGVVYVALYVHLVFAITTTLVWIWVIVRALRHFDRPVAPGPHSASHRRWGWIAAWDMVLTAVTGWIFYFLAFWL